MTGVGPAGPSTITAAATVVAAGFAALAWRHREEPGGRTLTCCLCVLVGWGLGYTLALTTPSLERTAGWLRLVFATLAFVPALWLGFVLQYTARAELRSRRLLVVLFALPAVTAATALSPWFDPLLVAELAIEPDGTLSLSAGPVLVATFVFTYLLLAVATLLLVQLFLRSHHLYRGQALSVVAAATLPWAGNVLYLADVVTGVDLTGVLFVASAAAMTLALARFRLLDPVPTGRRAVLERLTEGVLVLTDDWRVGDANPAARRLLGVDDPAGERIDDLLEPWPFGRDVETVTDWRELTVESDGETRFLEAQVLPVRDHHDRIVGRAVTVRDVTARKRRELALERYETIYESIREPVFVLDAEGRFSMGNEPFVELLEVDGAAIVGERPTAVFDVEGAWPADATDPDGGRFEADLRTDAGATAPCEIELAPVSPASEADAEGWVGVVRDVSRRKAAERGLAETAETLESVITASPVGVIACDREGTIELWNPAAESILGWDGADAVGRRLPLADDVAEPLPVVDPDRIDRLCALTTAAEPASRAELELRRADGERIDASLAVAPLHDPDGAVDGYVAVVDDVTERKRRERTLRRQNDRLETFASVLSHDLRNPLAIASGYVDVARETGDVAELERARTALDRMTAIIDDLLELARTGREVGETTDCSLEAAARDAWATVDTGDARLEVEGDRSLEADRTRLVQLLENLFRNAVEHGSGEAGTTGRRSVTVIVEATDEGFAVSDDGPGIPPDERESVFEWGYTTDEGGTGFGLAIVREVAEGHDWALSLTEGDAGGARFEFVVDRPVAR